MIHHKDKSGRSQFFPSAYRWADWGTATYLIPIKEVMQPKIQDALPLKRPLRKHIENEIEKLALQYVIATVVRSGMASTSAKGADPESALKWSFVKPKLGLIVYPPEMHKEGEQLNDEYNITLTPFVEDILQAAHAYQERHGIDSEYVFVKGATRTGRNAFRNELVKRSGVWRLFKTSLARIPEIEKPGATLHDVRAAFTEWACDRNDWPVSVVDVALGHKIKGIRNRTYFRNVRYRQQIRELMTDWQKFLLQVEPASIEAIPSRSQRVQLSPEGKRLRPWQIAGETERKHHNARIKD